ncbi:MAG: NUDIX domain-containing protein [Proteobacteria bacterium]|nr:NUDIX domain-containing protein [Pseudomonadota bacterium]MCP4915551.1 NUDIX domain-containing protein [Pseudomonadota bacterium]
MSTPRPAATVVVLRDSPSGPEVLMVQRSKKSGFMPDAHVFPGGRVDLEDSDVVVRGGEEDRVRMGLGAAGAAYQVAAVRECYEEAGVLLARGEPDDAARTALQDRKRTFGDVAEELGWEVDASDLVYWSWWITPKPEPKRYDTRFFVARVGRDVAASHDRYETVDSAWWTVAGVLERFDRGEVLLAPPTFRTLWEMRDHTDVESILAAGRGRVTPPIEPRARIDDGVVTVLLPGDPEHPSDEGLDGPTRHTLSQGRWFVHR